MTKRKLKPYVGVILVIFYGIDIFWLSGVLARHFGQTGIILHEMVLLLMAVGAVIIFRGDMKRIFPFHKPQPVKLLGTFVLWFGMFWGTMLVTIIVAYFFPSQVFSVGQSLGNEFYSIPFFFSFLIVCITPAICEEAAFRGALLSCFRGFRSKWAAIILVSAIFGAFHGSIWRFFPTALLGGAMAYMLLETDNMVYNMLFHLINNAAPLVLLKLMAPIMNSYQMSDMTQTMQISRLPLASVGVYMVYGGAAPLLIYIGNHLIHHGQQGYNRGLFPADKKRILIGLLLTAAGMIFVGISMIFLSIIFEMGSITSGVPYL